MKTKILIPNVVLLSFSGVFSQYVDSIPRPQQLDANYECRLSRVIGDFDADGSNDLFMIWEYLGTSYGAIYSYSQSKYLSIFKHDFSDPASGQVIEYGNIDSDPGVEVLWKNIIFDYTGGVSKKKSP